MSSPFGDLSLPPEAFNQEDNESLFESLSDAKGTVVANTYYYTTALLEKIVSFETENPDKASRHWEELVEKTKGLVELLEEHQKICETHFSSNCDAINETLSEIHFYNARLAEYEAEESTTDALVARNNYLSSDESAQNQAHEGSALASQSAQVPVNFHHAAEAYRSISKNISADDITGFHEMMALCCEARASEMAITAVANTAHVHGIKWPHDDLTIKAQQAYDTVITACTDLAPKFSDTEFESEQHEIRHYLQEATNRKLLLEVQLQEDRVNSLLSQELNPASSEHEKLLHHENLLNQLEIFQTTSRTGLEEAPWRLQSLWRRFHQEKISSAIKTTTAKLKENISQLFKQAPEQARATLYHFH
ncbi:MAG: hypothetical protein NT164_03180 [Verrucomicrobiae bacterium]|nr:hypothetical protein [Verrucomicrobiae bacterium]